MPTRIKAGTRLLLTLGFEGAAKYSVFDFRQPNGGSWSGQELVDNQEVALANPQPLELKPLASGDSAAIVISANLAPAIEGGSVTLKGKLAADGETKAADARSAAPDAGHASLSLRFDLAGA